MMCFPWPPRMSVSSYTDGVECLMLLFGQMMLFPVFETGFLTKVQSVAISAGTWKRECTVYSKDKNQEAANTTAVNPAVRGSL